MLKAKCHDFDTCTHCMKRMVLKKTFLRSISCNTKSVSQRDSYLVYFRSLKQHHLDQFQVPCQQSRSDNIDICAILICIESTRSTLNHPRQERIQTLIGRTWIIECESAQGLEIKLYKHTFCTNQPFYHLSNEFFYTALSRRHQKRKLGIMRMLYLFLFFQKCVTCIDSLHVDEATSSLFAYTITPHFLFASCNYRLCRSSTNYHHFPNPTPPPLKHCEAHRELPGLLTSLTQI